MAEALKCKVCGGKHALGAPHVWVGAEKVAVPRPTPIDAITKAAKEMGEPTHILVSPDNSMMKALLELKARDDARKAKAATYMRGYRARNKTP